VELLCLLQCHQQWTRTLLHLFFFFWWYWSLNSGLCTYKTGTLPLVHFALVILEMGVLWIIYLVWLQTAILSMSASQVARIIGMRNWRSLSVFFTLAVLVCEVACPGSVYLHFPMDQWGWVSFHVLTGCWCTLFGQRSLQIISAILKLSCLFSLLPCISGIKYIFWIQVLYQ
jgi:hypothetical protein